METFEYDKNNFFKIFDYETEDLNKAIMQYNPSYSRRSDLQHGEFGFVSENLVANITGYRRLDENGNEYWGRDTNKGSKKGDVGPIQVKSLTGSDLSIESDYLKTRGLKFISDKNDEHFDDQENIANEKYWKKRDVINLYFDQIRDNTDLMAFVDPKTQRIFMMDIEKAIDFADAIGNLQYVKNETKKAVKMYVPERLGSNEKGTTIFHENTRYRPQRHEMYEYLRNNLEFLDKIDIYKTMSLYAQANRNDPQYGGDWLDYQDLINSLK